MINPRAIKRNGLIPFCAFLHNQKHCYFCNEQYKYNNTLGIKEMFTTFSVCS